MRNRLALAHVLGPHGPGIAAAMQAGLGFLKANAEARLLFLVGSSIAQVPAFEAIKKPVLRDTYGGNQTGPSDDFLVGDALFYLNEQMWAAFLYELVQGKPLKKFAGCVTPDETALSHRLFTAALASHKTQTVAVLPS